MALVEGDDLRNRLVGTDGDDTIFGYAGSDELIGLDGSDYLLGGLGDDILKGGAGDDFFIEESGYGSGNDKIVGGSGIDIISYFGLSGAFTVNLWKEIVVSGNGTDSFTGVEAIITGSGPARVNFANKDNFAIVTGANADTFKNLGDGHYIDAGKGRDTIDLKEADGQVFVDLKQKLAQIGSGTESRILGVEVIFGATNEQNKIFGSDRGNDLKGGRLDDELYGRGGHDHIRGGDGDDILDGGAGDDWLDGGKGNDALNGGRGTNTLKGGDGDDSIVDLSFNRDSVVFGGAGADTIRFGLSDIYAGSGDDRVIQLKGSNDFNFRDYVIKTGGGKDYIKINTELMDIFSGSGSDEIIIDSISNGAEVYVGRGNDKVTANFLDQNYGSGTSIFGEDGDDIFNISASRSGTIYLYGGEGYDELTINADRVSIRGSNPGHFRATESVKVVGFEKVTLEAQDREIMVDIFSKDVNIIFSSGAEYVNIVLSNYLLNSAGGDDSIFVSGRKNITGYAAEGNDLFQVQNSVDISAYGGGGNDTIYFEGSSGYINGGSGNDKIELYESSATVEAGIGDDKITVFNGSAGNIDGGAGDDMFIFTGEGTSSEFSITTGIGSDTIALREFSPTGIITVSDFEVGVDKIAIGNLTAAEAFALVDVADTVDGAEITYNVIGFPENTITLTLEGISATDVTEDFFL